MRMKLVRANPAGNITLLVLDAVPAAERPAVAARLMQNRLFAAEQVGFVVPSLHGGEGRLEMMGGEFCGNAARSLGLLLAQNGGAAREVLLEVSGISHPICVFADPANSFSWAQMPPPLSVFEGNLSGVAMMRVDFEGITHLVVFHAPDEGLLASASALLLSERSVAAWGVLFLDAAQLCMTPVVTVRAMGVPVWESSCGSGSVAAAAALLQKAPDGCACHTLVQPGGSITVQMEKRGGKVVSARIGGAVEISAPQEILL